MSEQAVPVQRTSTGAMLRTLGIVAALCGLVIVATFQITFDRIEANARMKREQQIFKILPGATSIAEYQAFEGGIEPATTKEPPPGAIRFFGAYDGNGKLVGIAAEALGKGYGAEPVRLLFAYGPDCQCVTGIGVISMKETPGIGDKIITDKQFLANFQKLDVRLSTELSALANEIKVVKHGTKTQPWQIDAITGATITSRAVGRGINDAAQALLPKLVPNIDKVRSK